MDDQPKHPTCGDGPTSQSRRLLLKRGLTAMPVVFTLQSGAALARSSNLISAAPAGTTDAYGNTLCLDTSTVYPLPAGYKYDLGEPPYAQVNVLPKRDYYAAANSSMQPVSPSTVCEGGTFYYRDRGWREINLPHGIVVSATALTSVAANGGIMMTEL